MALGVLTPQRDKTATIGSMSHDIGGTPLALCYTLEVAVKYLGTESVFEVLHVGAVPCREQTISMMAVSAPPTSVAKETQSISSANIVVSSLASLQVKVDYKKNDKFGHVGIC